jgi:hypothetical protein
MKTRAKTAGYCALGLLAVLIIPACSRGSHLAAAPEPQPPAGSDQATNAGPTLVSGTVSASAPELDETDTTVHPPAKAEPAPGSASRPIPPDLKLSPATLELVKLVQAGVPEPVMLAYVTNSTGTFNLGADQIVYLHDLGVSGDVIRAMIEQDRRLRELGGQLPPLEPEARTTSLALQSGEQTPAATAAAPQPLTETSHVPTAQAPEAAASAQAPTTNVTYQYFYSSLAPYGTWVYVDGYGYCWQPSVVVLHPGWRPYCHGGRWVYTDLGWYWHSDYSWGWATFHYGRWFAHPRWGWLWWPDTVWAPAWVTWRYHPAYCGWAPLPPYVRGSGFGFAYTSYSYGIGWSWFTFVSWTHFHDRHPHRHRVRDDTCRRLVQESTVVNNIIVADNNTIINAGISPDRVREHTGREVRPLRVRPEPVGGPGDRTLAGLRERLDPARGELITRRLALPEGGEPIPPSGQRPEAPPGLAVGPRPVPAPTPVPSPPPAPQPELAAAAVPGPGGISPAPVGRAVDRPGRGTETDASRSSGPPTSPRPILPTRPDRPQHERPLAQHGETPSNSGAPVASAPAPVRPSPPPQPPAADSIPTGPAPPMATVPPNASAAQPNPPRSTVTVIGRAPQRSIEPSGLTSRNATRPADATPRSGPTTTWTRPGTPPATESEATAPQPAPLIRPSPPPTPPQAVRPAPAPPANPSPNVIVVRPSAPPGFREPAPHPSPRIMSSPQSPPVPPRPGPVSPAPEPARPAMRPMPPSAPAPGPPAPAISRPTPAPHAAAPAPSVQPAPPPSVVTPPPAPSPRAAGTPSRGRAAD